MSDSKDSYVSEVLNNNNNNNNGFYLSNDMAHKRKYSNKLREMSSK